MKALFFSTQGVSVPFLGIELEIMEELKLKETEIFVLKCDQKLAACYLNPIHSIVACSICQARSKIFYNELGIEEDNIIKMEYFDEYSSLKPIWFDSLEELFEFHFDGLNLGIGVASSLISIKRDYNISSQNSHELINKYIKSSVNVYLNIKKQIQRIKPDVVYLFNGRFAEAHPVIEYCKSIGLDYITFEKGSNYNNYETFFNSLPHSIKTRQVNMDKYWAKVDDQEGVKIAEKWFYDKSKGTHTDNVNYLTNMVDGMLPEHFDVSKRNVVIFNSSEDEFKAIKEWQNSLFSNQNEAIENIVSSFIENSSFHFYLRSHPNLEKVDNQQTQGIKNMSFPNLTVIPSSSNINSYDLMKACEKVIGFGSSTIVEATFWGKPSILFGKSFYMDLGCVYNPKSYTELKDLILKENLPVKDKTLSYKYAYFLNKRGQRFKWFNWNGKLNSDFKGKKIKRIYFETFVFLFKYLNKLSLWMEMIKLTKGRSFIWKDLFYLKDENVLPK